MHQLIQELKFFNDEELKYLNEKIDQMEFGGCPVGEGAAYRPGTPPRCRPDDFPPLPPAVLLRARTPCIVGDGHG